MATFPQHRKYKKNGRKRSPAPVPVPPTSATSQSLFCVDPGTQQLKHVIDEKHYRYVAPAPAPPPSNGRNGHAPPQPWDDDPELQRSLDEAAEREAALLAELAEAESREAALQAQLEEAHLRAQLEEAASREAALVAQLEAVEQRAQAATVVRFEQSPSEGRWAKEKLGRASPDLAPGDGDAPVEPLTPLSRSEKYRKRDWGGSGRRFGDDLAKARTLERGRPRDDSDDAPLSPQMPVEGDWPKPRSRRGSKKNISPLPADEAQVNVDDLLKLDVQREDEVRRLQEMVASLQVGVEALKKERGERERS